MRIIRGNNDNNDDDNHEHQHPHQHVPAPETDAARMAETLIDEAEAFLAAQADSVPFEPDPVPAPKPVARLVKSLTSDATPPVPVEDENLPPALRPQPVEETASTSRRVPRWVRSALPGSAFVVVVAGVATHAQPAVVAVPIDIYAGAWVGFLFWNAAHRPPLRDVAAGLFSGAIGLFGAVMSALLAGIRVLVTGISRRRGDFEATRTAA